MKVKVNNDACIGCGACTYTCDAVFGFNDEGIVEVKVPVVPEDAVEAVNTAIEGCPVSAISVVKEEENNTNNN